MARDTSKRGSGRKAPLAVGLDARPTFGLDLAAEKAPTEFRILRAGLNPSEKGTFLFDDVSAESVMAKYALRGVPMCMDYEHQSLVSPPIEAPASAKQIVPQVRNGELWATDVTWTDRGRSMVEAGEYRLFSPAFRFDETEEGELRVTELINVALTNNPALHGIQPLMAASAAEDKKQMDNEELTALKAECARLKKDNEELSAKLTIALKKSEPGEDEMKATALRNDVVALTGQTAGTGALGVLKAWQKSHGEVVELRAKFSELEQKDLDREFVAVCSAAAKEGKITPGEIKDETNGLPHILAKKDGKVTGEGLANLKRYVGTTTAKVTVDGKQTNAAKGATVALSAQELDICKRLGNDPDEHAKFIADRDARAAAGGQ